MTNPIHATRALHQPGRYETLLWLGALVDAIDDDHDHEFLRDWIAELPDGQASHAQA
jgi:hypothetical protein